MATSTIKPSFMLPLFQGQTGSKTTFNVNFTDSGQYLVFATVNGMSYNLAVLVNVYGNGTVYTGELYKGSNLTLSTATRKLTVTSTSSQNFNVNVFALTSGGKASGVSLS